MTDTLDLARSGLTIALCLIVLKLYLELRRRSKDWETEVARLQVAADEAETREALTRNWVRECIPPAAWTWDLVNDGRPLTGGDQGRLRAYTATILGNLQKALDADDEEMAQRIEGTPDAPRRMPRYPQVPAFIAKAEDAVTGLAAVDSMVVGLDLAKPDAEPVVMQGGQIVPPPTDDQWKVDVKAAPQPKVTEDTGQPRVSPKVTDLYADAETPEAVPESAVAIDVHEKEGVWSVVLTTREGVEIGREDFAPPETHQDALGRLYTRLNLADVESAIREGHEAFESAQRAPRDPFVGMGDQ